MLISITDSWGSFLCMRVWDNSPRYKDTHTLNHNIKLSGRTRPLCFAFSLTLPILATLASDSIRQNTIRLPLQQTRQLSRRASVSCDSPAVAVLASRQRVNNGSHRHHLHRRTAAPIPRLIFARRQLLFFFRLEVMNGWLMWLGYGANQFAVTRLVALTQKVKARGSVPGRGGEVEVDATAGAYLHLEHLLFCIDWTRGGGGRLLADRLPPHSLLRLILSW